jgi:hypothetical protein
MIKFVCNTALLLTISIASCGAFAWDGVVGGKIGNIDNLVNVSGSPSNFDVRITLTSGVPPCGNTNTWVYIDVSDTNFKGTYAALLQAKAMDLNVNLYSNRDGRGYCHLGYLAMN